MIPNIQTGTSFRGAELYYLHDKRQKDELLRLSDDRVGWTTTRNTAHDAADDAFAEMIATARDQDALKIANGTRLSGRPCEQPVMTISLAWHPSERPSKDEMVRAADGYLKHMGWDEHQAVYVAHNDTAHPHVHIILNRIHPETGRVLNDAFSKNRTQEWARAYEREHGRIWCEERTGKDYGRADTNQQRSMPHDFAIDAREAQHPYAELEEAARTLDARERAQLAQHHQDEREAFFETRQQQFRAAREAAYREVRAAYKPRWVEHFRDAAAMRDQAAREAAALALHVLACARHGDFAGAWQAVSDRDEVRRQVELEIAQARRDLRAEQRSETREQQDEACAALYEERAQAFVSIKHRQKEERAELKELQAARAEGRPYDTERLIALVDQTVAERQPGPDRDLHATQENAVGAENDLLGKDVDQPRLTENTPEQTAGVRGEIQPELGRPEGGDAALATAASDALAGGIGKLAELLAEVIAGILCPETEQQRAARLAEAKQKAQRQPEPAPAPPRHPGTSFSFDTYFGEHGERLRREQEEWWQKRREQNRVRER